MTIEEFLEDANTEKYLYLDRLEETGDGLVIEIMGTTTSPLNEQDLARTADEFGENVAELVKKSCSIDPNEDRRWRIVFESYISCCIINESCDNGDRATIGMTCPVRTVTESDWLDYVKKCTFADQIFDDIKHYQICCLEHIINVAAAYEPAAEKL